MGHKQGFIDHRVDTVKPWATSGDEAERPWDLSENLFGPRFRW